MHLFDPADYIATSRHVDFSYKGTGTKHTAWQTQEGRLHRLDGPAAVFEFDNTMYEEWYVHGACHRLDGPASIKSRNNTIFEEGWYKDGKLHRADGPALIQYENGVVRQETWYKDGKLHRTDGPAVIWYTADCVPKQWRFYENGTFITRDYIRETLWQQIKAYWEVTMT